MFLVISSKNSLGCFVWMMYPHRLDSEVFAKAKVASLFVIVYMVRSCVRERALAYALSCRRGCYNG